MPRVRPPLTWGKAPPQQRTPARAEHLHMVSGVSTCVLQGNQESAHRMRLGPPMFRTLRLSLRPCPPGVP